jgi:hypothetical protein
MRQNAKSHNNVAHTRPLRCRYCYNEDPATVHLGWKQVVCESCGLTEGLTGEGFGRIIEGRRQIHAMAKKRANRLHNLAMCLFVAGALTVAAAILITWLTQRSDNGGQPAMQERTEITAFEDTVSGRTLVRAHYWSEQGYSTKTCTSPAEADVWLTLQRARTARLRGDI